MAVSLHSQGDATALAVEKALAMIRKLQFVKGASGRRRAGAGKSVVIYATRTILRKTTTPQPR